MHLTLQNWSITAAAADDDDDDDLLTFVLHITFCLSTAALQSVFPQTELGTFMSLTKRDKERQLNELTLIVTGIRLFNRECGKGGEGIDDCKFQNQVQHTEATEM